MSIGSVINQINIYQHRVSFIDEIFNVFLGSVTLSGVINKAPTVNFGFFGNGNHITERMFTIDDSKNIVFFVKNVIFKDSEYRRSVYAIIKRKLLYVHLQTGVVFSDLFEYAILEKPNDIYFVYGGISYEFIDQIISKNPNDYKQHTTIHLRQNGAQIENNMNSYIQFFNIITKTKIGYYVPKENIHYLHVVLFLPQQFSQTRIDKSFFANMDYTPNSISELVRFQFNGNIMNKKAFKLISLSDVLESSKGEQMSKIIIGSFLCEIFYPAIFADV